MAQSTEPSDSPEPASPVRRLPLPSSLPPYDDEVVSRAGRADGDHDRGHDHQNAPRSTPAGDGATRGALALAIDHGEPDAAATRPELRLVGAADARARPEPAAGAGPPDPRQLAGPPDPRRLAGPPDPRRWAAKLTQAALESLYGQRPVQQLTRWTDETVYAALARRVARRRVRSAVQPRIRAIRVCRISATVAEAASIAQLGPQTQAVAVRLEADGPRWVCTAFELVERPAQISG